jgi:hypothetical protein
MCAPGCLDKATRTSDTNGHLRSYLQTNETYCRIKSPILSHLRKQHETAYVVRLLLPFISAGIGGGVILSLLLHWIGARHTAWFERASGLTAYRARHCPPGPPPTSPYNCSVQSDSCHLWRSAAGAAQEPVGTMHIVPCRPSLVAAARTRRVIACKQTSLCRDNRIPVPHRPSVVRREFRRCSRAALVVGGRRLNHEQARPVYFAWRMTSTACGFIAISGIYYMIMKLGFFARPQPYLPSDVHMLLGVWSPRVHACWHCSGETENAWMDWARSEQCLPAGHTLLHRTVGGSRAHLDKCPTRI